METLVWLRVPGDVVFALGTLTLAWFALRLLSGSRLDVDKTPASSSALDAIRFIAESQRYYGANGQFK